MSALEPDADHVVVGVDGSPASLAALSWARREAAQRRTPLEVVTAWPIPARDGRSAVTTAGQARALAEAAVQDLAAPGGPPIRRWVPPAPDEPENVLLCRAGQAQLLVVGPHGHHSLVEHLLGSVSEYVLTQALCPVAVVHETPGERHHRIVVGVDGSAASVAALRWAAREGALTQSKVVALDVWDWRPDYGVYPYGPDERQQRARAEGSLARAVVTLSEQQRQLVQSETMRGAVADCLLRATHDADLLVVGNNRPGHTASHVLGSVSRKVAVHARVPLVVVHDTA